MRREEIFVEYLPPTMNRVIGAPKGRFLHMGAKRKAGDALMVAGAQHIEPFCRPVEIWYFPMVTRGKSGRMLKEHDTLNYTLGYKVIEDCLVNLGVLPDDSRDWVYGAHCMRPEPADDGVPGIRVVIQEVDGQSVGVQAGMELREAAF